MAQKNKITKIAKIGYADIDKIVAFPDENAGLELTLINKRQDLSYFHNQKVRITIEVI